MAHQVHPSTGANQNAQDASRMMLSSVQVELKSIWKKPVFFFSDHPVHGMVRLCFRMIILTIPTQNHPCILPDWPRSWEPSAVIGGSLCFIEASNETNDFHRRTKNSQKYNNICLIVSTPCAMVSLSLSPQACVGPQNCSSTNKPTIQGFRRQNILFVNQNPDSVAEITHFGAEVAHFVAKIHYLVAKILFSRTKQRV